MRFPGLTLCLLASTLSARAASVEERVAALETRVKILEDALRGQNGQKPPTVVASPTAAFVDGSYLATLANGSVVSMNFEKGRVVVATGGETVTGSYEIIGSAVVITGNGKTEALQIEGDRLKSGNIEFFKRK